MHYRLNNGPELYFEYVPKGTLDEYLGRATTSHKTQVAVQIFSTFAFLHEEPTLTVHCDVKPANVLVQEWEVYTRQTKAEYGPLVDIWSVGVLFLCLEKGKLPHYLPRCEKDSMAWAVAIIEFARAYLRA